MKIMITVPITFLRIRNLFRNMIFFMIRRIMALLHQRNPHLSFRFACLSQIHLNQYHRNNLFPSLHLLTQ